MSYLYLMLARLLKSGWFPGRYRHSLFKKIKTRGPLYTTGHLAMANVNLKLDLSDFIQYYVFLDQAFEGEMCAFLSCKVKGRTFLDIGANIGTYALSLHGYADRVVAFEASTSNVELLKKNVSDNGVENVQVIHRAVSDSTDKIVSLSISPSERGHHSLHYRWEGGVELVRTITLDAFCDENAIANLAAIKIDVEGNELAVLRGAARTISRQRPLIVCEFNSYSSNAAGYSLEELYAAIVSFDYKGYALKEGVLAPYDTHRLNLPGVIENVVFLNDAKHAHTEENNL